MPDLALSMIRTDGGTQPRAGLNSEVVDEYAEAMTSGVEFPTVTVFYDGTDYWLTDGFHRLEAAKKIGSLTIRADVRQGTRREAILHSVGVNATHGLRRSNADKRRAVLTLLNDPEWSLWSNREVARRCGVSLDLVNRLRKERESSERIVQIQNFTEESMPSERIVQIQNFTEESTPSERIVQIQNFTEESTPSERIVQTQNLTKGSTQRQASRGGQTYTINTANIGRSGRSRQQATDKFPPTVDNSEAIPTEVVFTPPATARSPEKQPAPQTIDVTTEVIESEGHSSNCIRLEGDTSLAIAQMSSVPSKEELLGEEALAEKLPPPTTIPINTDDICNSLISHVEELREDQLAAVVRALATYWSVEKILKLMALKTPPGREQSHSSQALLM